MYIYIYIYIYRAHTALNRARAPRLPDAVWIVCLRMCRILFKLLCVVHHVFGNALCASEVLCIIYEFKKVHGGFVYTSFIWRYGLYCSYFEFLALRAAYSRMAVRCLWFPGINAAAKRTSVMFCFVSSQRSCKVILYQLTRGCPTRSFP